MLYSIDIWSLTPQAWVHTVVWFGQNCVPRSWFLPAMTTVCWCGVRQAWEVKDQISILYIKLFFIIMAQDYPNEITYLKSPKTPGKQKK